MTHDIIYFSVEEFIEYSRNEKLMQDNFDKHLNTKLDHFFSSYASFFEQSDAMTFIHNPNFQAHSKPVHNASYHHHHHHYSGHKFHKRQNTQSNHQSWNQSKKQPMVRKIIGGDVQNHVRVYLSLLNKINNANFNRIVKSIDTLSMPETVNESLLYMIQPVVQKCYRDLHYIDIYMRLLYHFQKKDNLKVKQCVNAFICDFVTLLPLKIHRINESIENNDSLSVFLKEKKELYDMHMAICIILSKDISNIPPQNYIYHLNRIFAETELNTEVFDIFIHLLYEFLTKHTSSDVRKDTRLFINNLFSEKNMTYCNKKTEFKIQDIQNIL